MCAAQTPLRTAQPLWQGFEIVSVSVDCGSLGIDVGFG